MDMDEMSEYRRIMEELESLSLLPYSGLFGKEVKVHPPEFELYRTDIGQNRELQVMIQDGKVACIQVRDYTDSDNPIFKGFGFNDDQPDLGYWATEQPFVINDKAKGFFDSVKSKAPYAAASLENCLSLLEPQGQQ